MQQESQFDTNPNFAAMKREVAGREFSLSLKGVAIVTAAIVIGACLTPMVTTLLAPTVAASSAAIGGAVAGIFLGGFLAAFATMRDRQILDIDKNILQGGIHGNTLWGNYRQEVLDLDHGPNQLPFNSRGDKRSR